jgi:hypothetical protein
MADIPELGVAPKSTGTMSGCLWLMAVSTLSLDVIGLCVVNISI